MKAPSQADRFVNVRAYLSDSGFGYDNWHARQFAAVNPSHPAVLILCSSEEERADALRYLEERAARNSEPRRRAEGD